MISFVACVAISRNFSFYEYNNKLNFFYLQYVYCPIFLLNFCENLLNKSTGEIVEGRELALDKGKIAEEKI